MTILFVIIFIILKRRILFTSRISVFISIYPWFLTCWVLFLRQTFGIFWWTIIDILLINFFGISQWHIFLLNKSVQLIIIHFMIYCPWVRRLLIFTVHFIYKLYIILFHEFCILHHFFKIIYLWFFYLCVLFINFIITSVTEWLAYWRFILISLIMLASLRISILFWSTFYWLINSFVLINNCR